MIKIYGMPACPYCDYIHEQIKGREAEFTYINIGENIRNMSAFMHLRDNSPVFDRCKEIGDVGIPAFVFEDGRVSIGKELIQWAIGGPAAFYSMSLRLDRPTRPPQDGKMHYTGRVYTINAIKAPEKTIVFSGAVD